MVLTVEQYARIRELASDFDVAALGEYIEELLDDAYIDGDQDGYNRGYEAASEYYY